MSQVDKNVNKTLRVSEDVIIELIANSAMEADGVSAIARAKKNPARLITNNKNVRAVKIELAGDVLAVTVGIILKNGAKAVTTAENVQEKVKSAVQNMLNLTVTKVNVNIVNVSAEE
ncbi:MAG: Asp23/Gls24 family envelope stress response protein [Ruminococcus sp.]|nr:Asp23/Gls24 family envelope stress response protein [Ruminococcus sp.]